MRSFNKTNNKACLANHQEVSCIGKVAIETYALAEQVLKRNSPKAPHGRSAYHCTHCQKWHIGTDNGGVNRKRTAQFKERKSYE